MAAPRVAAMRCSRLTAARARSSASGVINAKPPLQARGEEEGRGGRDSRGDVEEAVTAQFVQDGLSTPQWSGVVLTGSLGGRYHTLRIKASPTTLSTLSFSQKHTSSISHQQLLKSGITIMSNTKRMCILNAGYLPAPNMTAPTRAYLPDPSLTSSFSTSSISKRPFSCARTTTMWNELVPISTAAKSCGRRSTG